MSDIKRKSTYIDTSLTGLVVLITHNLSGTAYPELYTLDAGHKVFISLYDPRIAEFKNLDDDNVQITFASPFAGYLDVIVYDLSTPSVQDRVVDLEKKYNDMSLNFTKFTPLSSWKQMNNYSESKHKDIQTEIDDIKVQMETIRQEIDAL